MAWDLGLSEHGDLMFSGNRDLAGISGINLIEQRMKIRMRVERGGWIYDTDKTFGSNLHRLVGLSADQVASQLTPLVNEALRGMNDEISVDLVWPEFIAADGVTVVTDASLARGVIVLVQYHLLSAPDDVGPIPTEEQLLTISIPTA
jgi:hypothetical protein